MSDDPRSRARRLVEKFISSPVLPMLGLTKFVESIVAGGEVVNWAVYAAVVTALWVYGENIENTADEFVEDVTGEK